ncbi:BON domain-containing protein [Pedosphaera parvula]|uniref:Transport-associated protein n=1 Tax=Pedosphaera parvula (strain Ellin514) TaxID=320771 RepID=B9XHB0_PEDPL|nr:BON domain-containing protein [Pedosphaera parvula]EEF60745.1 transport-associated protein [Pedosphaera parvula Ellin514]
MKINLKQLVLAACLGSSVAFTGLTGCHTEGRSAGTYIDDRMVSNRVKGALNDNQIYKYPNVDVSSFNGTVQLNGFVASADQKQQAAVIASKVDGVKQLVNNITVQPMATGRANAPERIYENSTNAVIYQSTTNTLVQPQ